MQDQFQGRWSQSVSADSDRTRADSKFLKNSLSPHYYSDPLVLSIGVVKALKKKKKRQAWSGKASYKWRFVYFFKQGVSLVAVL